MAFEGGFWKGRFVPSSAFLHPQGGAQIEEKAHLQAALLTQSLGTLGQEQGSHHSGLLQHRYLDAKSHHFQRGLKLCLALEVQNRGPNHSIREIPCLPFLKVHTQRHLGTWACFVLWSGEA